MYYILLVLYYYYITSIVGEMCKVRYSLLFIWISGRGQILIHRLTAVVVVIALEEVVALVVHVEV